MRETLRTLRTAAIWIGLAAGVWLLWYIRVAVILAFGAVIAALLLHLLARLICTKVPLALGWALALVTALLFLIFAGCLWLFGSSLVSQFGDVLKKIEAGQRNLGVLRQFVHGPSSLLGGMVPHVLTSGLAVAEYAIVIAIAGIYLAAQPALYARGVVLLFPSKLRADAEEALEKIGATLTYWLIGQMIVMLIVSVLAYFLMLALGLPNPGVLALIAGLSEAVPYLGPFLGAVPAVLVALTIGFNKAIWTVAGYIGIHILEGYLIVPLLQRRLVHIPPALILLSILVSQLLFGFVGIIFAGPIAVVAYTAINLLYLRNVLEERVNLPDDIPVT
ncbi:MAG TPA: AI-2E family transporter [Rhizomicrobium sp.]|jgi:predicted PurR-regulated permease PerM